MKLGVVGLVSFLLVGCAAASTSDDAGIAAPAPTAETADQPVDADLGQPSSSERSGSDVSIRDPNTFSNTGTQPGRSNGRSFDPTEEWIDTEVPLAAFLALGDTTAEASTALESAYWAALTSCMADVGFGFEAEGGEEWENISVEAVNKLPIDERIRYQIALYGHDTLGEFPEAKERIEDGDLAAGLPAGGCEDAANRKAYPLIRFEDEWAEAYKSVAVCISDDGTSDDTCRRYSTLLIGIESTADIRLFHAAEIVFVDRHRDDLESFRAELEEVQQ